MSKEMANRLFTRAGTDCCCWRDSGSVAGHMGAKAPIMIRVRGADYKQDYILPLLGAPSNG